MGERTVATVSTVGVKPPDVHHVVDERQRVDHHDEHLDAERLEETRQDECLCSRTRATSRSSETRTGKRNQRGISSKRAGKRGGGGHLRRSHAPHTTVPGPAGSRIIRADQPAQGRASVGISLHMISAAPADMRCPSPSCPKPRGARIRRHNICQAAPAVRTDRPSLHGEPAPRHAVPAGLGGVPVRKDRRQVGPFSGCDRGETYWRIM